MWKVSFIFLVDTHFSIPSVWKVLCKVIFVLCCFSDCYFRNLNILEGEISMGLSERCVYPRAIRSLKKLCKFFLLAFIKLSHLCLYYLGISIDMHRILSAEAYDTLNFYFLFALFNIKVLWVLLVLVFNVVISILFLSHH